MNDLTEFFGKEQEGFTAEDAPVSFIPGKLPCIIKAASVEKTKKQTGHYVALRLTPLEGPCKETLFVNINIDNPNKDCVDIGLRILTSLREALGLLALTDTDQVVDKIVIAHVKIKDGRPDVGAFSAPGGAQPPVVIAPAPPGLQAPPAQPTLAPPVGHPGQNTEGIHRDEIPVPQKPTGGTSPQSELPKSHLQQNATAPVRPWENRQ